MARKTSSLRLKKRRGKNKTASTRNGLPLSLVSLLAFIAFSAILVSAVFIAQIDSQSRMQKLQAESAEVQTKKQVMELSRFLAPYQYKLQILSQDQPLRELFALNNASRIAQESEKIKGLFKGALRVRLLKPDHVTVSTATTPHLGYACVDVFNMAGQSKAAAPIEVHATGTAQQHIDVVHAVISDSGELLGYIQLVLESKLVQQWGQLIAGVDYIEIYQHIDKNKQVVIARAGDSQLLTSGLASAQIAIPGTNWRLRRWQAQGFFGSQMGFVMSAVMLIGVILAGVIVWILRGLVRNALQHDIDNLLHYTIDTLRGKRQYGYEMRMPEFRQAVRQVDAMVSDPSAGRERDDDSNSVDIKYDSGLSELNSFGASQFDLPLIRDDVIVEEVDSNEYLQSLSNSKLHLSQLSDISSSSNLLSQSRSQNNMTKSENSDNSTDAFPPAEIFKAYDIRGIVGKSLTAQSATLIGRALGSEAAKRGLKKMAFARDGRLSGPMLGQALVQGIMQSGVDVMDVGMVPTPVLYYAAAEYTDGTGVMLTGSHNPPDYNGFKMVLGGETLASEAIQDLRRRIEDNDFVSGEGQYETALIPDEYINRITGDVKLNQKLRIAVDCGNGVAGDIAPKLYRAMGCDVTELYCDVDGNFPNHHPDPSKPENLQDLIEMVTSNKVDVGFAFDGDGDRLGVVSPDGSIIYPDRLMMLFAEDVLSRNHGAQIIYDIKCSNNLTKAIREKNGEPLMWKTGHSLIKAKMKSTGALLAGEMSGHIFFKERWYGFDDGLYSGARLLEIISNDARPATEIFASLPDAVNTPELNVQMTEGEHHRFMEVLMDKAKFGDAKLTMIDGLRVDYPDAWGLVRASNTTPVLVLRFEGNDQAAMQRVQDEFRLLMLSIDPKLDLPF